MNMEHTCNFYCHDEVHCDLVAADVGTSSDRIMRLCYAAEEVYDVCFLSCKPAPEADIVRIMDACRAHGIYVNAEGKVAPMPDILHSQEAWLVFFKDATSVVAGGA